MAGYALPGRITFLTLNGYVGSTTARREKHPLLLADTAKPTIARRGQHNRHEADQWAGAKKGQASEPFRTLACQFEAQQIRRVRQCSKPELSLSVQQVLRLASAHHQVKIGAARN